MTIIGARIKDVRRKVGLSQADFGARLGVSRDVISNIETDRLKTPGQKESLYRLICREYGVDEHWLRTGDGEMFLPLDRNNQIAQWAGTILRDEGDSFRKRFVAALSKLEERDWIALEQFLLNIKKTQRNKSSGISNPPSKACKKRQILVNCSGVALCSACSMYRM